MPDILLSYDEAKSAYQILMNQDYCEEIWFYINLMIRDALAYAATRAQWAIASDKEAIKMNQQRTSEHDSLLIGMAAVASKMNIKGFDISWYSILGSRQRMGDFACCIAYEKSLEAR